MSKSMYFRRICIPTRHQFNMQPDRKRRHLRALATAAIPNSKSTAAQLSSNEELAAIVHQFSPGVDYAFGYGSGVFRQANDDGKNSDDGSTTTTTTSPSMIDIILAVRDPHSWHKRNMERHSEHYSSLARWGGPHFVTQLQVNFGAKLYFHPFVNISINVGSKKQSYPNVIQRQIKYGVVSTQDLIHDLVHWDYLYLAGRMHKPIVSIELTSNVESDTNFEEQIYSHSKNVRLQVEEAQRTNLVSAVSASLLLQSSTSSMQFIPTSQLYNSIAGLSYTGDFRMRTGAEDPNKIKKLVETPGMMERWDELYSETLGNMQKMGMLSMVANDNPRQDTVMTRHLEISLTDMSIRRQLATNLPQRLQKHSDLIIGSDDSIESFQNGGAVLRRELANIVSPAAQNQSLKGFITAGVGRSWKYALAKFAKGRLRK